MLTPSSSKEDLTPKLESTATSFSLKDPKHVYLQRAAKAEIERGVDRALVEVKLPPGVALVPELRSLMGFLQTLSAFAMSEAGQETSNLQSLMDVGNHCNGDEGLMFSSAMILCPVKDPLGTFLAALGSTSKSVGNLSHLSNFAAPVEGTEIPVGGGELGQSNVEGEDVTWDTLAPHLQEIAKQNNILIPGAPYSNKGEN